MHELGIVFHIMDTVEQVARDNHVEQVRKVVMELGEVSGVVPQALTDCWDWAKKRAPLLEQARMEVQILPAQTLCRDCGQIYPTVAHGRICPWCASEQTHLLRGAEINILQIEVV